MTGTEKIIAHIEADAEREAAAIAAEAEKKCEELRMSFEKQAKEAYSSAIRVGVKAGQERLESMDRFAKMEGKKAVLALKQELVEKCFDRALEMLTQMPEGEYEDFLTRLALRACKGGEGELILNVGDGEKYGARVVSRVNREGGAKLRLSQETGSFRGGLVIRFADSSVNCTAEQLIASCRDEMSAEAAKALFE